MKTKGVWAGLMLLVSLGATGVTVAADGEKPTRVFSEKQLAQQQRMKDCAADAKQRSLKGSDRMAFMQTCLSGGSVTATVGSGEASVPDDARMAQREKTKVCKAEARQKALKGNDRKDFMVECLAK